MNKLKTIFSVSLSIGLVSVPIAACITYNKYKNYVIPTVNYDLYKEPNNYLDFNNFSNDGLIISKLAAKYTEQFYLDWFNSLTINQWDENQIYTPEQISNLSCNSERQALQLFANNWGYFWNYYLHQQQTPPDKLYNSSYFKRILPLIPEANKVKILGSDYKYIDLALDKAKAPLNLTVYHGVEFMETEFYNQLQDNIIRQPDGKYDYTNCVGKTITSHGWLATSVIADYAKNWSDGSNFTDDIITDNEPPLKDYVCFKINIPKDSPGVASIEGLPLMNWTKANFDYPNFYAIDQNWEGQTLIKRNTSFTIQNVTKEYNSRLGTINVFEMILNKK